MSTPTLQTAIGDLATDIQNQKADLTNPEYYGVRNVWKQLPPYWEVVQQSGGTYTPGTSWRGQFETDRNAADRMEYRIVTSSGEVLDPQIEGDTSVGPRRYKLTVFAEQPMNVKCTFSITGTSARIQIFVNGSMTEYTTPQSQYLTVSLVQGYNTITICTNTLTDLMLFKGKLFDGVVSFWVDPLAPRNPVRDGYTTSGGSSGGQGSIEASLAIPSGSEA